jgi:hypothetical protein
MKIPLSHAIFLILMVAGILIVAFPESNTSRIVELSNDHGPSLTDGVGLVFIAIGYIPLIFFMISKVRNVSHRKGLLPTAILCFVIISSFVVIYFSVADDQHLLLTIAVSCSIVAQFVLLRLAWRVGND